MGAPSHGWATPVGGAAVELGPSAGSVDVAEAEDFLRMLHAEYPAAGDLDARLRQVRREIAETGTYVHTSTELTFGARVAWRNSNRCIGRLYWRSLLVRDLRTVSTPEAVFVELVRHLEMAVGDRDDPAAQRSRISRPRSGGHDADQPGIEPGSRRLRPVISIFAPPAPGTAPAVRLWNDQLIRYAGYRNDDGTTVGDPRYVAFTEAVRDLGWRGKGDRFDVLPLVIEGADGRPRTFELPEHAVVEVPITHPDHPWFAELGLRWYAVPAIANMRLSIGGVDYPLAPFNGWYMGTEIGARNLADTDRYDQLPVVAARLGLDMSTSRTLWRDSALVELNRAVLFSFEQAGLRISDHHSESRRFLDHLAKEERAGRVTPADWSWIVPPMSASVTPVFHRYYDEVQLKPNFYLDPTAAELARNGRPVEANATAGPAAGPAAAPAAMPTQRVRAVVPVPVVPVPVPVGPVPAVGSTGGCPVTGATAPAGVSPPALPRPRVRPAVPQPAQQTGTGPVAGASRWRWPFRQRPDTRADVPARADRPAD
jgi:nitric-oxide synthase